MQAARDLFSYKKYWASRLTPAPVLPMSRAEMDELGWDECDVIIVTGDAYVDHPSFGMAVAGLEFAGSVQGARYPAPILWRHCGQHGFDGQPFYR